MARGGRPAPPAVLRRRRRGAPLRPGRGPAAPLDAAVVAAHPRARGRARRARCSSARAARSRSRRPASGCSSRPATCCGPWTASTPRPRELASAADDAGRRLLPRQRGRGDAGASGAFRAEHPDVGGAARRPHLAAHPRRPAGRAARRRHRAGPGGRPRSCRLGAARPGARRPRRRAARPPPGRPRRWSTAATSTASRCSSSTAPMRRPPTTRSRPTAPRWAPGPRWVTHAATQVERVLDLVAVGDGHRLAQRLAGRARQRHATDVVVRPAAARSRSTTSSGWPGGPATRRRTTAAFVRVVLETCGG